MKTYDNKLDELEDKVLQYYLSKGYKLFIDQTEDDVQWNFKVEIISLYKNKSCYVYFETNNEQRELKDFYGTTTKEMFEKAINFFKVEELKDQYEKDLLIQEEQYNVEQTLFYYNNQDKQESKVQKSSLSLKNRIQESSNKVENLEIEKHKLEFYKSLEQAVLSCGGSVDWIGETTTLEELADSLAQNRVRFYHDKIEFKTNSLR